MSRSVPYSQVQNINWNVNQNDDGRSYPPSEAQFAVLMDIRRELRTLNAVFACYRFQAIPTKLDKLVSAANLLQYRCPHHPKYQGKSDPKPCTGCRRVRKQYLRS